MINLNLLGENTKKKKTKQRIDIVITKAGPGLQNRSIYGVELKAINTSYNGILNDLKRMSDAMISEDHTEENSLLNCYSGFIKCFNNLNKPLSDSQLKKQSRKAVSKIESLLNNNFKNNTNYKSLEYKIHQQKIYRLTEEEYFNRYAENPEIDLECYDAANDTGEVLGVVIEIKRK